MTSVSLMHEAQHPESVLWDNLEIGWGGRWEGIQDGVTCDKIMLMYGRNHHNIVK